MVAELDPSNLPLAPMCLAIAYDAFNSLTLTSAWPGTPGLTPTALGCESPKKNIPRIFSNKPFSLQTEVKLRKAELENTNTGGHGQSTEKGFKLG